jgi:hypothetical protein
MSNSMKHILLLVVMLALVAGSSVARADFNPREKASDVEGVTLDRQKAFLKPGYQFESVSSKSVAVVKISNVARIQTGTITCVGQGNRTCKVYVGKTQAQCSGGCYFVGARGGVRAA